MTQRGRTFNPILLLLIFSALLFIIFLMVSGFLFLNRSADDWEDAGGAQIFQKNSGLVGVVELKGVILDSKKVLKHLKRFEDRDEIKAVVLRLDSPGGSVAPSQEIYEAVRAFPKPLVVSMGSVAASGAYYIAAGSKHVFANPGTITGSIGVIMEFVNLKKLYDWAKIKRFSIRSGEFKGTGSPYRDMTPAERKVLQAMIDDTLEQFRSAVATGRKMKKAQVERIADGRIFNGRQALKLGLIDKVGTFDEAVAQAAKLAKIEGEPRVVYPRKNKAFDWMDFILDQAPEEESRARLHWAESLVQGVLRQPGMYMIWDAGF